MIPPDHQSSVAFLVGTLPFPQNPEQIKKMYKSEVKTSQGTVNGKAVDFWHFNDPPHMCMEYIIELADSKGEMHPMQATLIANTTERLTALETAFSTIGLP